MMGANRLNLLALLNMYGENNEKLVQMQVKYVLDKYTYILPNNNMYVNNFIIYGITTSTFF